MSDWNSSQYVKFGRERTQPSADLINRLGGITPERSAPVSFSTTAAIIAGRSLIIAMIASILDVPLSTTSL